MFLGHCSGIADRNLPAGRWQRALLLVSPSPPAGGLRLRADCLPGT
jgi:hypothetical protein